MKRQCRLYQCIKCDTMAITVYLILCSGSIWLLQVSPRWTQNAQRGKHLCLPLYCPPTCCVQLFNHALTLQSPHHFEIC